MDEYFHILYESLGLKGKGPAGSAMEMGEEVYAAVALRTTALNFAQKTPISGLLQNYLSIIAVDGYLVTVIDD